MVRKIELPNFPDLLRRYLAGEPEQKLARECGVTRTVIRRHLLRAGVQPRTVSDSMFIRWKNTDANGREAMLKAAHAATTGRKATPAERRKRAATVQGTLVHASPVELELTDRLRAAGLSVTPQKAVDIYNIDIAVDAPPIAVEIFGGNFHATGRHLARHFRRTKYLLNSGWSVLIVWVDARRYPLTVGCDQYIIQWAKELRRNPPARGEYRVILGNGKTPPVSELYLNTDALIKRLGGGD